MLTNKTIVIASLLGFAGVASAQWNATVFEAAGNDAASVQEALDAFRAELGDGNRPDPGSVCEGRREINWDGAPDSFSAPNLFPGDFFNAPTFPRARGAEFTTPGTGFQLSATADSGEGVLFDNLGLGFSDSFAAFSPQRLFVSLGSNITFVDFFIPGSDIPATSRGFGVVFTDVDVQGSTSVEFFNADGDSLGLWEAPAAVGDKTFSFVGVSFEQAIVSRVKIISGNDAIDSLRRGTDFVAMDDFIFGEPVNADACPSDCPADLTGDGILDLADVTAFVTAFTSLDPAADLDSNGVFDLQDILVLAEAYTTGCPS